MSSITLSSLSPSSSSSSSSSTSQRRQKPPFQLPQTLIHPSTPPKLKPTSQLHSNHSWSHTLHSEARSGLLHEAISTYIEMITEEVSPDEFAFPAVLKVATELGDSNFGKQVHAHVVKFGYMAKSRVVDNTLVSFYGKCGGVWDARKVFDEMSERDQVSWNSFMMALCRGGMWDEVFEVFRVMVLEEGVEPSSFTLVGVVSACGNLGVVDGLKVGKQAHGYCLRKGFVTTYTVNALMAMYAKLGRVEYTRSLLCVFEDRDLVTWNTAISSFSQNKRFDEALEFFKFMVGMGVEPDGVTIASVLPSCSRLELLDFGKEIHAYVLRRREFSGNSYVVSGLVDMYCNCKQVSKARRLFNDTSSRSVALWNAMLAGYTLTGHFDEALMLFINMLEVAGVWPNPTTLASVLPSCVHGQSFRDREGIHSYIIKWGFEENMYVQNALMDMYSRMGKIDISEAMFGTIESKDIVSWNTMITSYVVCGRHSDALALLHEMHKFEQKNYGEGENGNGVKNTLRANSITLMAVLPGCASLSALAKGKEIHAYAIRHNLASDVAVGSALVDMYAKCGCLTLSRRVFDCLSNKNVITWNVLIMAYGMHGKGKEAFHLFKDMAMEASRGGTVKPNGVTFIAVLAACSHSGLVNEGLDLFYSMKNEFGLDPISEHYACVVDLLGRAGKVEAAYELIKEMPDQYDKTGAWSSLLGACRVHKNLELGEIAAGNLIQLEPHVDSHYILLSNLYASAGFWEKSTEVRNKMKQMGVKKEPGCSWIEFGNKVHKFRAGDALHPQIEQLYSFIEDLSVRMKKEGYVPDTSCVLHNLNEAEKESLLCGHSEKLAIAFGIINTPPGSIIRVAKNLRVCNDCHEAAKFISTIERREIILRDVKRFHHFKDGSCSCGEYW
ncbi:hypothetical protein vseg_010527 [Gypsophila vaccaria]